MGIEERADSKFHHIDDDFKTGITRNQLSDSLKKVYIESAIEQKKADEEEMADALFIQHQMLVEKACRLWHKNILKAQITEEEFRKAMEENE